MTIDLRGLAPALKAHAKARHLTVSDAARLAVAAALETPPLDPEVEPPVNRIQLQINRSS